MRARALITAALAPLITAYLAVAALLALVTATATHARFDPIAVLLVAGPSWLATYQVPLEIGGQTLGVLPLLPTIGVFVLIARAAACAALRLGYREPAQVVTLIGTVAGTHATVGAIISVLADGHRLEVEPLPAFVVPGLVAGLAAMAGTAGRCGLVRAVLRHLDPVALHGLRAGALAMAALLTAGAMTFAISSALSAPAMHEMFRGNAAGLGDGAGILLLSLGYLPNAVLAGLGFAAGPGFSIGDVTLTPAGIVGGPVPELPLFAAIPESYAPWWPILVLLPAAAGALVGWSQRRSVPDPRTRVRVVVVAGALAAFAAVVLGALAGGRLAGGPFDPVSFPLGTLSIAVFVWIALPGTIVTYYAGARVQDEPEPPVVVDAEPEDVQDSGDVQDSEDSDDAEDTEDTDTDTDTGAADVDGMHGSDEDDDPGEDVPDTDADDIDDTGTGDSADAPVKAEAEEKRADDAENERDRSGE
jgi:hypothetical protein